MRKWMSVRRLAAAAVLVPGIAVPGFADNCAVPAPQCAAPNCYRPCTPQANPQANQQGLFVAPTPSGEVQGESNSLGINLPALRIPESTIRLPTIQLPSLVKYRREPEMVTDQARATFQAQPAARLQFARPQAIPQANPQANPGCNQPIIPCVPGCTVGSTAAPNDEVARLQQQVSQLTVLVGQLAAMQQGQQAQAAETIQPAGYQGPAPRIAPADQTSQTERQISAKYEQKCRELAEMQEQLSTVQWEYQALLEAKQAKVIQQREGRLRQKLEESEDQSAVPKATSRIEDAPTQPREALRLRRRTFDSEQLASNDSMADAPSTSEAVVQQKKLQPQTPVEDTESKKFRWFRTSK